MDGWTDGHGDGRTQGRTNGRRGRGRTGGWVGGGRAKETAGREGDTHLQQSCSQSEYRLHNNAFVNPPGLLVADRSRACPAGAPDGSKTLNTTKRSSMGYAPGQGRRPAPGDPNIPDTRPGCNTAAACVQPLNNNRQENRR